jgi:outer membrane protein OmpA-like peptidoglycan-associated protein
MCRAALIGSGLLLLAGCASSSEVGLLGGDDGKAEGSVAVTDAKSGADVATIDQPGAVATVGGTDANIRTMDAAAFEAANRDLLAGLPEAPRAFTLYFKENSVDLAPESEPLIPVILAEINRRPGADVQIIGHTDTMGSFEVNDGLSLRRAAEVTATLFALGLDKTIVRLAGRGEREPKEATGDEVPSAINRRVELLVR